MKTQTTLPLSLLFVSVLSSCKSEGNTKRIHHTLSGWDFDTGRYQNETKVCDTQAFHFESEDFPFENRYIDSIYVAPLR